MVVISRHGAPWIARGSQSRQPCCLPKSSIPSNSHEQWRGSRSVPPRELHSRETCHRTGPRYVPLLLSVPGHGKPFEKRTTPTAPLPCPTTEPRPIISALPPTQLRPCRLRRAPTPLGTRRLSTRTSRLPVVRHIEGTRWIARPTVQNTVKCRDDAIGLALWETLPKLDA